MKDSRGARRRSGLGRRSGTVALFAASTVLAGLPSLARADELGPIVGAFLGQHFDTFEVVQFALFAGAMTAALASALWLIRERGRTARQNTTLRTKVSALNVQVARLETLATTEGQRAVIWEDRDRKPVIIGTLTPETGAPPERSAFLAFGRWLEPASATQLDHLVAELREEAKPFSVTVETRRGVPLDVIGRTNGSSAVLRFENLSGERAEHARLALEHGRVVDTLETLQALLDSLDAPFWLRSSDGALAWVNRAFAQATGHAQPVETIAANAEFLGNQALKAILTNRDDAGCYHASVSAVVNGDRLLYDVTDATGPYGSAGLAVDRTDFEATRSELNKTIRSHEETLDRLNTAVAMFDENARLRFYNQEFQKLWDLDQGFLDSGPDNAMFLDRLRADGRLEEKPDWRDWKDEVLSAYRAVEPREDVWYLPDGQTIRVVANPHPRGGLTWVFENLTETIDLQSRYETLVRVQGETLDNLAEGVAVFGQDGRLRLSNPAFRRFWDIEELLEREAVHIGQIARICDRRFGNDELWSRFAGMVTGFADDRSDESGRCAVSDSILSWTVVPLPNGQTMITFVDITASEGVERALRDRNEALEGTALLRTRFIRHVSYELRTPLTNISGFTALLQEPSTGPLNEKQSDYVGYIAESSEALKLIIDDTLDLATIDAGVMELDFTEIDIEPMMREVAADLAPRFAEHRLDLVVRVAPDMGTIYADATRLHQIMINVLSNAADFAPEDTVVTFTCDDGENGVRFKIRDRGPGIPAEALKEIFDPFETGKPGRRRGAGLGLALVKSFVTLHQGDVTIDSSPERGTEVTLFFPRVPPGARMAAE
ncbi:PAS domain-containing sensor histidine kinase [Oricola sp.]|uniref:sensor histidine kinase n=1 Tax=Oricola sp. TaxID=1979950 RepID=UPI0025F10E94|nr:PAS domain-containing sensor histidine kinase [Oricola sp.]MCI5077568.1 ATP-binding protein [Oricola sp.]